MEKINIIRVVNGDYYEDIIGGIKGNRDRNKEELRNKGRSWLLWASTPAGRLLGHSWHKCYYTLYYYLVTLTIPILPIHT